MLFDLFLLSIPMQLIIISGLNRFIAISRSLDFNISLNLINSSWKALKCGVQKSYAMIHKFHKNFAQRNNYNCIPQKST